MLQLSLAACTPQRPSSQRQPEPTGEARLDEEPSTGSVNLAPVAARSDVRPAVLVPSRSLTIPARRSGFVSFQVEVGDEIRGEAPLFSIVMPDDDARRTQARAELTVSAKQVAAATTRQEKLDRTAADLSQVSEHVAGELVRNARFDAAIEAGQSRVIKAQRHTLEVGLSSLEQSIADGDGNAPFAGIVASIEVDPGAWVSRGQPLVRVESKDARRLRFAVAPGDKPQYEVGSPIRWGVNRVRQDQAGSVVWLAPRPDPITGLYFAEAGVAQTQSAIGSALWIVPNAGKQGSDAP